MANKGHPQSSPEWIVVYSTYSLPEAHVVAGRLEFEGIKAFVHQQAGARAFGITLGPLGEITVLVSTGDYERALAILEPVEPDALPDTTDDTSYLLDWDDEDDSDNE